MFSGSVPGGGGEGLSGDSGAGGDESADGVESADDGDSARNDDELAWSAANPELAAGAGTPAWAAVSGRSVATGLAAGNCTAKVSMEKGMVRVPTGAWGLGR